MSSFFLCTSYIIRNLLGRVGGAFFVCFFKPIVTFSLEPVHKKNPVPAVFLSSNPAHKWMDYGGMDEQQVKQTNWQQNKSF